MIYVRDECAMLALLRGEPGSGNVKQLLVNPSIVSYAHSVNIIEVYYDFLRASSEQRASDARSDLALVGIVTRRDLGQSFCRKVGQLKIIWANIAVGLLLRCSRLEVRWQCDHQRPSRIRPYRISQNRSRPFHPLAHAGLSRSTRGQARLTCCKSPKGLRIAQRQRVSSLKGQQVLVTLNAEALQEQIAHNPRLS
jgi:PIN domain nuclease of toxin-antitoxin system